MRCTTFRKNQHVPSSRRAMSCNSVPPAFHTPADHIEENAVKFDNKATGHTLVGTLVQGNSKNEAVVLCHGFASHRDGFHFPTIAARLAQRGVASLRFDFSGNGDSEGTFEFGNYVAEAKDIRAAVEYMESESFKVVGLVGHSKGGNDVLIYASLYDDIPRVVNIAGRFDCKRGINERFGPDIFERLAKDKQIAMEQPRDDGDIIRWTLTKWSMEDRVNTDMKSVASKIRSSEVLTVHGAMDRVIPVEDAYQWGQYIVQHELKVIDGAGHSFLKTSESEPMVAATVNYLCQP